MVTFTDWELGFMAQAGLGRLATIAADGMPHVVPVGWKYNPGLGTIDVGGHSIARTKKFKNVQQNPNVAFVIDDVLPPWRPRCVMIRGQAEALADAQDAEGHDTGPIVRITPKQIISWGTDER